MFCKFCNKECKNPNSLRNHERLCKSNPNRQTTPFQDNDFQVSCKKGNQYTKAKELGMEYIISDKTRQVLREKSLAVWTDERRAQWSERMKLQAKKNIENHPESYSYKNFCGRAKKSLYKDEWMHSSWELLFAVWMDEHNIKWTKKVRYFEYEWNDAIRKYFPDFYLADLDLYVEVKGYQTDRDIQKWKSVSNLIVLTERHIKQIKENKFDLGQVS